MINFTAPTWLTQKVAARFSEFLISFMKLAKDRQRRNGWRHVKIIVDPVLYFIASRNIACGRFWNFKTQWKF